MDYQQAFASGTLSVNLTIRALGFPRSALRARLLWKTPGPSAAALLALVLGMGATTALFSVLDAVLLKPLPFHAAERLLAVWENNLAHPSDGAFVAPANFRDWQRQSHCWEAMAAIQDQHTNLTGGPNGIMEPEELQAERVTASMFSLLGVQPVVGRAFRPEEDQPGHADYALLSYELWQRRFGADPAIAGKTILLRGRNHTVLGVLPAGFSILNPTVDLWLPLALNPNDARTAHRRYLTVVARLKPSVSIDRARKEMEAVGGALETANAALNRGWRPLLVPLDRELVGRVREALLVLTAAVGFLLLIACANVANLLLARGASRRKDLALRGALGASRGRIVLQLLAESVALSLVGGVLGLALARGGVALLVKLGSASIPRLAGAGLDLRLFLFALVASVATGVLFGLAPAIQGAGTPLNAILAEGGRGGTAGRTARRVRNGLVILEVALAVVVLIGAGLSIRSFARLRATNPGFQPSGLLTLRLPLGGGRNAAPERRVVFLRQVEERLAALPGVRAAAMVNSLPLTGLGVGSTFAVAGRPTPPPDGRPVGVMRSMSPAYFHTAGIPLIAGRGLTDADTAQAPPVVVVDQTLARRFWPGANPIGGSLVLDTEDGRVAQIVGVVGSVKIEHIDGEDWPTIYCPYAQCPGATSMMMVVRTAGAPLSVASAVERTVRELDPAQPVARLRTMESVMDQAASGPRFNAVLLAIFAQIAFLLAAVGIYGVISYDVSQRTHELGIRMALGAGKRDVFRLVLGQGARLAAWGIAAGLAAAFALTRLMASILYSVKPTDAWTFAAMSLLLGAVALVASYLPSRRAMALDPMAALWHE